MEKSINLQGLKTAWHKAKQQFAIKTLPQQVGDHLFYLEYNDWDEEAAEGYAAQHYKPAFACSVVRDGNTIGRNFDWYYSNSAEFVIRMAPTRGRHASIGVAGYDPEFTVDMAKSGDWYDDYNRLPYYTTDGINDAGVFVELNVVAPNDVSHTTGTNPLSEHTMCVTATPRYLLDNASSAAEAIQLLQNLNIYAIYTKDSQEEFHLLIADSYSTYVVEFIDNAIHVISDVDDDNYDNFTTEKPIMTNFVLTGWDGDLTSNPWNETLNRFPMGFERAQIIAAGLENNLSMIDILESVKYTKTYTEIEGSNPWLTEFCGDFGEDGVIDKAALQEYVEGGGNELVSHVLETAAAMYATRERDNADTWITSHACVYDIDSKSFKVYTQENFEINYEFKVVDKGGGGDGTNNYADLENKPKINNVTLSGNKTASNLGLATASDVLNTIHVVTEIPEPWEHGVIIYIGDTITHNTYSKVVIDYCHGSIYEARLVNNTLQWININAPYTTYVNEPVERIG